MKTRVILPALLLGLCSCASTPPPQPQGERLTVGTVQREIRIGMTGSQVAEVLGSPNIVTTDEKRREVWIYDKLSTEASYASNNGFVFALILGASTNKSSSSTSQQTLTVIIKFDENKKVYDFAYHASRF
jgi:outer membrane protein assembly factor BamE (lipoprotein component of BamABCDE complex)